MAEECRRANETPIEELLAQPDSEECLDFLRHCEGCAPCRTELERHRQRGGGGRAHPAIAVGGGAAAILIVGFVLWTALWSGRDDGEVAVAPTAPNASPPTATGAALPERTPPSEPAAAPSSQAVFEMRPGTTVELRSSELPDEGAVTLSLALELPPRGTEPLEVEIRSMDGRVLDGSATFGGEGPDGLKARTDVDVEWLVPGTYLVEVKTREPLVLPLRRYPLKVR